MLDHQGSGCVVAQAAGLAVEEHHDDAQGIGEGQKIDDAHQIADGRFQKASRRAVHLDDLGSRQAFPWRLAVPSQFKDEVVAPDDSKVEQRIEGNDQADNPVRGGFAVGRD